MTSSWRCEGTGAGLGGFAVCYQGAWVGCEGVGGPLAAWRAAAGLAFAVVLWMRSPGWGASEDEVEDVDEDEDDEEVVVLGDAGFPVIWAGAGFCRAEDGGHVLGPRVGVRWLGELGRDLAAWRADPVGSAARGSCGAAVSAFWAQLGWAPAMREGVWVGVRGGKQFAWAAFGSRGGFGPGFRRFVRGACWGHWAGLVCREVWGSLRWVCGGCRVWGLVRGVRRESLWRVCMVVWAGGGGPCRGTRGCARWWAFVSRRLGIWGGEGQGEGLRGGVCCVGVYVRLQWRACVVTCRPGG